MRPLDWVVLAGFLAFIVLYGLWRGRHVQGLRGYLLSDRDMRWPMVALSVMATQASAITFLSTPGQGYVDGMRFVQFYFGLPIAMVVLCATAVPIFHRLGVYTAYEYLERRFDLKTRTLAAGLFLIQRGLAAGLTIFAPSLILSVLLGWNLHLTNVLIGALVIGATASGGARAVSHTQFLQFLVLISGLAVAFVLILQALPPGVSFGDAAAVAGHLGRFNAVDFSFDPQSRYNLWSGLIGGCFLALSYFGTDQSQVGRYLTGRSIAQSRLGLLFNGLVKVPMQFGILLLGAMLFVFYQFVAPPLFFNPIEVASIRNSSHATAYAGLEAEHRRVFEAKTRQVRELIDARHAGDAARRAAAAESIQEGQREMGELRGRAVEMIRSHRPGAPTSDTNYVFLTFVLAHLPVGVVGLALAATFAASMSSTSAELNALASTTVVDVYKRLIHRGQDPPDPRAEVRVSKLATVFWGVFAVGFAEFASHLGSLIEAVNILGSLFYGTILGIFLAAFYLKRVQGDAVFFAALIAEVAVIACFTMSKISFLWYNVVGCLLVLILSLVFTAVSRGRAPRSRPRGQRPASAADPAA